MTDVVTQSDLPVETAPRIGYVGKRLGRFLITGELGRGGMATVYRARDPELGRDVAIKVMHGFFAGRVDLEARFRREASTVATIRHPSILNVYDFAAPAGEEPGYIVSELIEGPGLRSTLEARGGRLRPEVAALIVARVADALGATHAAGIVHRDVKPDNVLIDRAGGHARVVLTDFGVAHVSSMDTMTATGAVVGSPAYMSPEQARSEEVGAPSDVFSLGVMLYQLATGHLPFSGKDPLAAITATLRGQYRRPSEIEPRVGPEVEKVIVRCLQGEPGARFPNGTAVAEALRTALGDTRATAHLEDEEAALRRFFDDPGAFEAALAAPVAEAALAAAERARKGRQLPRALAELGRALAYEPEHTEAKALLARLNARRAKPLAMRLAVPAIALLVAGGAVAWHWSRQGVRPPAPPSGPTAPAAASPPPPIEAAPAASAAPAEIKPAPVTAPAGGEAHAAQDGNGKRTDSFAHTRRRPSTASPEMKPRSTREASHPEQPRAGTSPVAASPLRAQPVANTPVTAPSPAPATTPDAIEKPASKSAPPLARASVALHASYGFCEPSLDGHAASLRASYSGLQPGPHEIYCTLPQGGPKLHVATYDLPPGARASVVIIPGPDGRPIIGKSE